jgi:predicted transposase YdaD
VRLRSGRPAFLYLLFEHKSRPDRFARLQLLRYTVELWDEWHRGHPRALLPPVLPVVFYHGNTRLEG